MSPVVDDVSPGSVADDEKEEVVVSAGNGSGGKRKRAPAKPKAKVEKGEKKPPKPKEVSKLTGLYLLKVAPALAKEKKEREVKFNLRCIDEYIADEGLSKQQFLALLHFIDQPSLVIDEFEFRQDIPYAITNAGFAKIAKMQREIKECKETITEEVASQMSLIQDRFSNDRYKLPANDRDTILKCQAKGNGCVRIILVKTTLEQFLDQRARNESVPSNKKPKQIRFLGAHFRYEPVFDVVYDEEIAAKPVKRRKKAEVVEGSSCTAEEAAIIDATPESFDDLIAENQAVYEKESEEEDAEVEMGLKNQ